MVVSLVGLAICAYRRSANFVLYPLEQRFPKWDASRGEPDGIIVLGGPLDADLSAAHGVPVIAGAADRIIAAAALAHRYPNARLVFTGGSANLISNDAKEADYAAALFQGLGIPKSRLAHGTAIPQHQGERRILQASGRCRSRASAGCW